MSAVIDSGPANNADNVLYVTITLCQPGSTTNCATIPYIQVDTGSTGLRVLASVLPTTWALPQQHASDNNPLVECFTYADNTFNWGPIVTADITVGGKTAGSTAMQLIGSSSFPNIPAGCGPSNMADDTVATLGANGIIGVSPFIQDCGSTCATTAQQGYYYSCTGSVCNPIAVPLTAQVPNPITKFATDNNGLIVELPTAPAAGEATLTGTLVFGVNTETNNQLTTQTIVPVDDAGYITAEFNGVSYPDSFIDTGSNGWFFTDSSITQCANSNFMGFYCPASPVALSATISTATGLTGAIHFTIASAQTLADGNPSFSVFPELGGTNSDAQSFDFGLPFYVGRSVYHVIEGETVAGTMGPFLAF